LGSGYNHFQATAQVRRGVEQANALVWRMDAFQPGPPHVVSLGNPAFAKMTRAERTLLKAIAPQRRIAIRAESPSLRVYVLHLDVIGFTHKIEQFGAVIADMATRPPVPLTLVAGDLNTFGPPGLQLWRRLAATASTAGLLELTQKIRSTHWTSQKLDAIFVRATTPIRYRAWALDLRASDHRAVFVDIQSPPLPGGA
jgi:endonuclease/exonuclease/phosphatase family metal-dependent hydrolase